MKILLLAIRTLFRFKSYTLINILGLALSLACVITISRYIFREMTVDNYTSKADRICLTIWEGENRTDRAVIGVWDPTDDKSYPDILKDPAVEAVSAFIGFNDHYITVGGKNYAAETIVADTNFLKIIDHPIIAGNTKAFDAATGILITEAYARKVFGEKNPVGQTVTYITGHQLTVSGVIGKLKGKSSLHYDILVPMHLQGFWDGAFNANLVLVYPHTDIKQFNQRHSRYTPDPRRGGNERWQLAVMKELYFTPGIISYQNLLLTGDKTHIRTLSVAAMLLLIIGVFNFINIYTVVLLRRNKELGMKKVFGSNTSMLLSQLYIENLFMTAIALLGSWFFIELSRGAVEVWLNIPPSNNVAFDWLLSLSLLAGLPFVTIIYPFFRYHYANPSATMHTVSAEKGKMRITRPLFLTLQYCITFCLIVVSLFFIKQLNAMLHNDQGYRTQDIIQAHFKENRTKEPTSMEEFKEMNRIARMNEEQIRQQMDGSPLFSSWTYAAPPYAYHYNEEGSFRLKVPEGGEFKPVVFVPIAPEFMTLFEFRLTEGTFWDKDADNDNAHKLILNRKAMETFGFHTINNAWLLPESAFNIGGDGAPCQVIGVVEDFHFGHLSKPIQPTVFAYSTFINTDLYPLLAAVIPGRRQDAIAFLEKLHNETVGGTFNYTFAEQEIKDLYKEDKDVAAIYSVFALIAILISSMGLFSLSLFDIQQRYKEIAIRKINGATTPAIMKLLLRKYYLLLLISFIIAAPLSWLAIYHYLKDFSYQTAISWWLFVIAAIVTGGIALITIIWQIRKAARTNPAEAIKSE